MPHHTKLLVIDDDHDICTLLSAFLSKNGYQVSTAYSGKAAITLLNTYRPELVLCDFRLDDMTGADLLEKTKQLYSDLPFIIMTGYSDVRTAVQMMKLGAADYVTKPLLPDEILASITKCIAKENKLSLSADQLKPPTGDLKPKKFFGKSAAFNQVLEQITLVAPTNFSVIIYGESGSGKESVAREIHARSKRSDKPFIAIDCGSISK